MTTTTTTPDVAVGQRWMTTHLMPAPYPVGLVGTVTARTNDSLDGPMVHYVYDIAPETDHEAQLADFVAWHINVDEPTVPADYDIDDPWALRDRLDRSQDDLEADPTPPGGVLRFAPPAETAVLTVGSPAEMIAIFGKMLDIAATGETAEIVVGPVKITVGPS